MRKSGAEQPTIPIRAIRNPIMIEYGIAMLTLSMFVWMGALAHAEEQPVRMSNPADMIGKLVKNSDGKNLGTIKDLVINWRRDGYIEYAVLSFGGFLGMGDEYVAVPWEALTPSDNKDHFVLNMKKKHLTDTPGFVVYRFYDRSSVAVQRSSRSTPSPSTHMMKGDIGSDLDVFVARAEFHR